MHFLISFSLPRGPFVRNVCWLLLNDTVYLAVCVFCVVPMDIFTADFWRCFSVSVCCVTFRYCAYCLCVSDGSMDPIFSERLFFRVTCACIAWILWISVLLIRIGSRLMIIIVGPRDSTH